MSTLGILSSRRTIPIRLRGDRDDTRRRSSSRRDGDAGQSCLPRFRRPARVSTLGRQMNVWVVVLLIFVMVGFNALYVAAEFATVGSRRSRIQENADDP